MTTRRSRLARLATASAVLVSGGVAVTAAASGAGAASGVPTSGAGVAFDHQVVGTGGAALYPADVVANATHYFVLDPGNDRVVKISRATGQVVAETNTDNLARSKTTSGRGLGGFDSDGNFYVTDSPGDAVVKVSPTLQNLGFFPPKKGDAPNMDGITDVTVGPGLDADGNPAEIVYVSEKTRLNQGKAGLIRKFLTDGTYIGDIGQALPTPRKFKQMVVDPANGDLYAVEGAKYRVVVFGKDGSVKRIFGSRGSGNGQFQGEPRGISLAPNGDIFVTDSDNYRIQVFRPNGSFKFLFGGQGTADDQFEGPRGNVFTPDGLFVVCDLWGYALKEFQTDGTAVRKLFGTGPSSTGVNLPKGFSLDPNVADRMQIIDWWSQRIMQVGTDGSNPEPLGGTGARFDSGALTFPRDVEVQPGTGLMYVANRESHEIQILNPDGSSFGEFGEFPDLYFPQGVAFAPNGDLWVTDSGNHRLVRYAIGADGLGTVAETVGMMGNPGTAAGRFKLPGDMVVAPDGTLYVADTGNRRIQKRDTSGVWSVLPAPVRYAPWGIDVGPDGNLWVTDTAKDRLIKVAPDGTWLKLMSGVVDGKPLNALHGVQVDAAGTIYVADGDNDRVLAFVETP